MAAFEFRPPPQPFVEDPTSDYWKWVPPRAPIWDWMIEYSTSYCLHISDAPRKVAEMVAKIVAGSAVLRIAGGIPFTKGRHCATAEEGLRAYVRRYTYRELDPVRYARARPQARAVPIEEAGDFPASSTPESATEASERTMGANQVAARIVRNAILFFQAEAMRGQKVSRRLLWIVQQWARRAMTYRELLVEAQQHKEPDIRASWAGATEESLRKAMSLGLQRFVHEWNDHATQPPLTSEAVLYAFKVCQEWVPVGRIGDDATAR